MCSPHDLEICPLKADLTQPWLHIDPTHPYLVDRAMSRETLETVRGRFLSRQGVNVRSRGRSDPQRKGAAYAGRSIDNSEPKNKFTGGLHKSLDLFNLHRVTATEVIVVEGFFDCLKVWQIAQSIRGGADGLYVTDGDDAGRNAAEEIARRLPHGVYTRVVDAGDKQRDQLMGDELQALLR